MRVSLEVGGEVIDRSAIPWTPPWELLDVVRTPLLRAVDPHGDAVFNRFQCERQLPDEIKILRAGLVADAQVRMLDELDRLRVVVLGRPHRYLWFFGD